MTTMAQGNNKVISVWIEDRDASWGPIDLQIGSDARLGELRCRAASSLGVAPRLQHWVVGRTLCADDTAPLRELAGPDLTATFYLFLVDFDLHEESTSLIKKSTKQNIDNIDSVLSTSDKDRFSDVYTELMQLEQQALVPNTDPFECQVCTEEYVAGSGVMLRDCLHAFCRNCLADMICHSEESIVRCPDTNCSGTLHEREIRALVSPEEHERWLARSLAAAESRARNAYHCQTVDCRGWVICDDDVRQFLCPVCKHNNCLNCQTIHVRETCEQYRSKLKQAADEVSTNALLESLVSRGEALRCPGCNTIITKAVGCDWIKCSACKIEICWATRGRRWGPAGRGDTSAGCRCGVNGKRCHPSCGNCH